MCADRGPVAETDVGTVGNGREGASFLILRLREVCVVVTEGVCDSSSMAFSLPLPEDNGLEAGLATFFDGAGCTEGFASLSPSLLRFFDAFIAEALKSKEEYARGDLHESRKAIR